jgi:hypothetical protein
LSDSPRSVIARDLGLSGISKRTLWLGLSLQVLSALIAAGILKVADLSTSSLTAVLAISTGLLLLAGLILVYLLVLAYGRAKAARSSRDAAREELSTLEKWRDIEKFTGLIEYAAELSSSDERPKEKLPEIDFELRFMGNGGSKWTRESAEFQEMLRTTAENHGTVRLLLLDPTCQACIAGSQARFDNNVDQPKKIVESLCRLKPWERRWGHFEVKLYSHTPHFRISLINNSYAVLGHYREYKNDSDESPLLVFTREDIKWTFYRPIDGYYRNEWDNAEWVDWEKVDELAKTYGVDLD